MKRYLLSVLVLFLTGLTSAQVTVFTDDFSTNQSTTYTTSGAIGASAWSVSSGGTAGQDFGARRNTSPAQLELTNDATAAVNQDGWAFAYTPTTSFTSPYTPVLNTNVGVVTWTFNMRQIRPDPGGFVSGSYGVAFVLGGTSTTAATAGNGYAVVLGNAGSTDPIRLVRYLNGLQGTLTDIIASNIVGFTDFGAEYLSIKVTYTPSSDTWELFLRDDNGPPFADPASGTLTSQGTQIDNTYTGVSLDYLGGYWQGSTTPTQTAFFDNVTVTVTYPNTITTGTVFTPPFLLANCAATAAGTVDFTTTDVFGFANTFTAQLSDDIGSFAAPVFLGAITIGGVVPSATIPIVIPAGTVSGTGYRIRVVSDLPVIIGSSSAAFQIIQSGLCASSHTDYYRSITSGDWGDPTTWESSSDNFATVISPATLAPTFNANTITIRNGHTVTIAAAASSDQLTIQSGGVLNHSNGVAFTLNDGSGTDMAIQNNGTYVLNGTQPSGAGTVDVLSGALVRVDNNSAPSDADDFAFGNANVTFNTGCTYEWNTILIPAWSGRIYFTIGQNTKYKFSVSPGSLGGSGITIVYGHIEANSNLTIINSGTKTFTNGIIGTGNIDASAAGSGAIIINGPTSVLGGGTLTLQSGVPLQIIASTATMTSSKTITGDINLSGNSYIELGNFDLTVSGFFSGYGTNAYVKTNGTGYLKILTVTGPRAFPVGNSSWNPVNINIGNSADYSVRVVDGITPPIAFPTYGINRTWSIFASANTSGVEVGFQYATADANAGVTPGVDLMEVLLYSGAAWSVTPNNVNITPTGANPWLVTTTALGTLTIGTSATPYALGKNGGWILPIDCIISTRAQKQNNTGIISWTVNSCAEVNSFEVQRSVNNSGFRTIGTVNPVVNQTDFSFTDATLASGTNLYRIKVNRFSGSSKYSNTVAIIHNSSDILIAALAPNPVHDKAILTVSSGRNTAIDFKIFNAVGNLVKQWSSVVTEGNNTIEVNAAGLSAGMYTVFASVSGATTISRFVKQ